MDPLSTALIHAVMGEGASQRKGTRALLDGRVIGRVNPMAPRYTLG